MQLFIKRLLSVFILLFTTSFPIHFDSWLNLPLYISQFWEWVHQFWFTLFSEDKFSPILSDTKGLYIHSLFLILLSIIIASIWSYIKPQENKLHYYYIRTFIAYYLSLQLIIYGFNKLFLLQFPVPSSNILYTKTGDVSKDLLFWTSMSTSPLYNYFMGAIELLAALLLLYNRTRVIGNLLAIGIFINIVLINFSFDISVKFFSSFLLFLSILLITPYLRTLYRFFIKNEVQKLITYRPNNKRITLILKPLFIISFLIIGVHPYYKLTVKESKTIEQLGFSEVYEITNSNSLQWKRIHIHPNSYLIIEKQEGQFFDFELAIALKSKQFIINNKTALNFKRLKNGQLKLSGIWNKEPIILLLKPINCNDFPLLKKQFHWTID